MQGMRQPAAGKNLQVLQYLMTVNISMRPACVKISDGFRRGASINFLEDHSDLNVLDAAGH
jgi:hypothetical protein